MKAEMLLPIAVLVVACAGSTRSDLFDSAGQDGAAGTASPTGSLESSTGNAVDPDGTSDGPPAETNDPGSLPKLDVGSDTEGLTPGVGCGKVDFLFIVDNSGSMFGEQENLVASFPGFIEAIEDTLLAQDYHIMVLDTDPEAYTQTCSSTCGSAGCCDDYCTINPQCTCNGTPCTPGPGNCNSTLGAGRLTTPMGDDCGVVGPHRYMVDGQPQLSDAFQCVARVGTGGSGEEKPMEAMVEAIGPLSQPGACNADFVREDAILVVTFITDEEDLGKSAGNPTSWRQAVVDAKGGDETAAVVLGLIGDNDQPGAICGPIVGDVGADPGPRLREFAESFPFGSIGSVCAADYAPFFAAAVSVVDTACDEFEPPG